MRVTNHIVGGCPDGCCRFEPIMFSVARYSYSPPAERAQRQAPRTGLTDRRRFANNLRHAGATFGRLELEQFDIIHRLLPTGPLNRQGEDHDRNIVCPGQFLSSVA